MDSSRLIINTKEALMELKEKLEQLTKQKDQLEVALLKTLGAMEMVESLIADQEKPKEKKDK